MRGMARRQFLANFVGLPDEDFHAPGLCSFGGGGGGTTQTVQKSDPWEGEQPSLLSIYDQANKLNTSAVPQYYPGSTYAPLTDNQGSLINQSIDTARGGGNAALQGANSAIASATSPGYTSQTLGGFNSGNSALTGLESGNYQSSATPAYNQANGVLGNEMSAGYLNPWNSPSFGTVVNNTLASVIPQTSASFINGGRSDSGLAQRAQTMAATDAVGNLAQSQYNTNQGIQNQAAAQASQNQQNAAMNALGAAGVGTSNYLTQQGNQLKAASAAPLIDSEQAADLNQGLTAAGASQANQQNTISADMARWNYNQMQPWNQLGLFSNAIEGTGNPGGTATTSQPYFDNTLGNIASGVGTAGSLAMLGMMMFSDRELKTDIERIGESDSGYPLYSFRYKGESPMSRHIGLMAQDVEKKQPDAIVHTPIGMAVNYSKALAA